jgi:hypothetical protein
MSFQPSAEVCGRLRRMLIVGLGLTATGLFFVLSSLGSLSGSGPWVSGAGLLALLFGAGLIFAAWVGFAVVGAWRFRLRTLMIAVTILAVLLAAWPALVGPTFFQRVTFSAKEGTIVIENRHDAGPDTWTFMEIHLPLYHIGLWVPLLFPLVLLPFVLRRPEDAAQPSGQERG